MSTSDNNTTPDATQDASGKLTVPIGSFLDDDDVLIVNRTLAKAYGLNESVVLRQVHYWLRMFAKTKTKDHLHDGRIWVFNSYAQWKSDNFEFWSWRTIQRIVLNLEELGILQSTDQFNKKKSDRSKWYTINYGAHEAYLRLWEGHHKPTSSQGRQSPAFQGFIQDWNDQRQDPTITSSWHAHHVKLARPSRQVGTQDSLETPAQITTETTTYNDTADAAVKRLQKHSKQEMDFAFSAISAAWDTTNAGLIANYRGLVFGMGAVKGVWNTMRPAVPLSMEEFKEFVPFAKRRMEGMKKGYKMPTSAEGIANSIEEFRSAKPVSRIPVYVAPSEPAVPSGVTPEQVRADRERFSQLTGEL